MSREVLKVKLSDGSWARYEAMTEGCRMAFEIEYGGALVVYEVEDADVHHEAIPTCICAYAPGTWEFAMIVGES